MSRVNISTALQQYLCQYSSRLPLLSDSQDRRIFEKFYPQALKQMRKWFANRLNPFNLCPQAVVFWLLIPPFNAIGITVLGLREVGVFWRQQMEPNETVFTLFKIILFRPPFPLTLLIFFSGLGLVIADGANRLVEAFRMEHEEEELKLDEIIEDLSDSVIDLQQKMEETIAKEKHKKLLQLLNPFNLTARMSVYFPIYDNHTTLGLFLADFRHTEFSIKQSLEPNETVQSLIRFLDLYAPFPLTISVMLLGVGLFLTGKIYEYGQETREEIIRQVQRARQR